MRERIASVVWRVGLAPLTRLYNWLSAPAHREANRVRSERYSRRRLGENA